MTYYAGIRHHSVARSPEITINGDLTAAKREATRRLGDGYQDHEIVIMDDGGHIVSRRRIGDKRWQDAPAEAA